MIGVLRPRHPVQHPYPWANAGYTAPRVLIGYEDYPAPAGVTTLIPLATTDIIAHEITHDFFMREVWEEPSLGSGATGEIAALNEGAGDIMAFFTELGRDTIKRRPLNEIDQVVLRAGNLTIGEETGTAGRSLLTSFAQEWSEDLVDLDPHEGCGPIDRMFLLLAYGCQPLAQGQSPGPWNCPRVPAGFMGIGVQGSRRVYLVSAGTVSDSRGVQSVPLTGGLVPGFTVTLAAAPYSYLWNIAGTATVQSDIPFSISARDTWGNVSSLTRFCYVDTASTQDVFLNCHEVS